MAYDSLLYGVEHRKGFIVLTGEIGCGKTTACRSVLNKLVHIAQLNRFLLERLEKNENVCVIIDESQNLDSQLMEQWNNGMVE